MSVFSPRSVSCVLNVACTSEMSIPDWPFSFSNIYFDLLYIHGHKKVMVDHYITRMNIYTTTKKEKQTELQP